MKIVHFSTSDYIGAFRATYLLHQALRKTGVESLMLVKNKTVIDDSVIQIGHFSIRDFIIQKSIRYSFIDFVSRKLYFLYKKIKPQETQITFNRNRSFISFGSIKKYLQGVDIICLHWIDDFLSTGLIKQMSQFTKAPIVWTLMDMEPFTGGCHYNYDCGGFKGACGHCPQLKSNKENDLSRIIWQQKYRDLTDLDITFVAPSSWIYDRVREGSLFCEKKVKKILLSVDTNIFKKSNKKVARNKLQLPNGKKIIFFGTRSLTEERKGMKYLLEALNILYEKIKIKDENLLNNIILLTAGDNPFCIKTPFKHQHMGFVKDMKKLALLYQAADVFACPSMEDAGPMMVNEAIMCGTPVAAFDTGVAPDLIVSRDRGYLAEKYNVGDFCSGLNYFIFKEENNYKETPGELPIECAPRFQAQQYHLLFKEILNTQKI